MSNGKLTDCVKKIIDESTFKSLTFHIMDKSYFINLMEGDEKTQKSCFLFLDFIMWLIENVGINKPIVTIDTILELEKEGKKWVRLKEFKKMIITWFNFLPVNPEIDNLSSIDSNISLAKIYKKTFKEKIKKDVRMIVITIGKNNDYERTKLIEPLTLLFILKTLAVVLPMKFLPKRTQELYESWFEQLE